MSRKNFSASICLDKIALVAKTVSKKNKTEMVFHIPVNANFCTVKDGKTYLNLSGMISESEQDQYGQNGFIAQSVDSDTYKGASQEQKDKWKAEHQILGNIKIWNGGDNTPAADMAESEDDLPF